MLSTDDKIEILERKLFEQSQSIDKLMKIFSKRFSIHKKSKFSRRQTVFEDDITQNKGECLYSFNFHFQLFIYNLNYTVLYSFFC